MINLRMHDSGAEKFQPLKVGLPIFNFGSMRDRRVLAEVLGRPLRGLKIIPGTLLGYEAHRIKGEQYPAAVRRPGGELNGIVVSGLTKEDVQRITHYEGGDYGIEVRPVQTGYGSVKCQVYIPTRLMVERTKWDFGLYQKQYPHYVKLVREWMADA